MKEHKDQEMREKYQEQYNVVRDKISDDLDKDFEHLYKLERPLEEDEVEANNIIKALKVFDGKAEMHPERRVKQAFATFMEGNLTRIR